MRPLAFLLPIFTAISAIAQPLVDCHEHLFHAAATGLAPETATVKRLPAAPRVPVQIAHLSGAGGLR